MAWLRPDFTPFRYAFDNPISFTDPDGMYENGGGGGWDDDNDVQEEKTWNFHFKIGSLHENGNDDLINNLGIHFGFSINMEAEMLDTE